MTINRNKVREINADLLEALKSVAEKHNCTVSSRGGRFGETSFTPKIEFTLITDNETVTESLKALRVYRPELEGKTFMSNGKRFTIDGFKPQSPKFPILASNAMGKRYKFSESDVA